MKITQDVGDYAAGLSDNEKQELQLEAEEVTARKSKEFREKRAARFI